MVNGTGVFVESSIDVAELVRAAGVLVQELVDHMSPANREQLDQALIAGLAELRLAIDISAEPQLVVYAVVRPPAGDARPVAQYLIGRWRASDQWQATAMGIPNGQGVN